MALTIQDLQPKDFKINVKGIEVNCKPPRLSHMLLLSKIGETFSNIKDADREKIEEADADFSYVVESLVPELKDIQLDVQTIIDIITQIMEQVTPDENKELAEKGVTFDADPKAEKVG